MTLKDIEDRDAGREVQGLEYRGQEGRRRADPARGPRHAQRRRQHDPGGARRPCRPLPRPRDAQAGRVLLQAAEGHRRAPDHRLSIRCSRPAAARAAALTLLKQKGAKTITLMCLVSVPEGIRLVNRGPPRRARLCGRHRRPPERKGLYRAGPRRRRRPHLRHALRRHARRGERRAGKKESQERT
jgi:hypothetical protein